MRISVDQAKISSRFLEAVLLSLIGRSQLMRAAAGTSASMKKINRSVLSAVKIPLPPLSVQEEFEIDLDIWQSAIGSANSRLETTQKVARELREALL